MPLSRWRSTRTNVFSPFKLDINHIVIDRAGKSSGNETEVFEKSPLTNGKNR